MSYYANGDGCVDTKTYVPEKVIDILEKVGFDTEEAFDGGLWLTFAYDNYYEDNVIKALKKLAPYVASGEIAFHGEDDSYWKFVFEDGKVFYYNGEMEITYTKSDWDLYKEEEK